MNSHYFAGLVIFRYPGAGDEISVTPPDSRQRKCAWFVPASHTAVYHQGQQLALSQEGICQVEAVKFNLPGMEDDQLLHKPVVKRRVIFKFQCANGMRDLLDGISLTV